MNLIIITSFARLVLAAILFIGAIFLMYYEKDGWGWCLFLGLCAIPEVSFKREENDQKSN